MICTRTSLTLTCLFFAYFLLAVVSEPAVYPYFIHRTRFQSLPVYTDIRNGGTRKLTLVRRIEGDLEALRSDLSKALDDGSIQIKGVSRQLVIKGDRLSEVRAWLTKKGF
ncbi:hypothetical protein GQ54DRAFT_296315 [Martensiomyces pterosporus]|nr:hypothetical protein GQ54DRAFT_296315 [Martensiomyces pterosporus]